MRRQLAAALVCAAVVAMGYAVATLLPGQLLVPDVVITAGFGTGIVLTAVLTVWHIRFTVANRFPRDPGANAVYKRLYRRWAAAWPRFALRAFSVGFALAMGMTALSLYQLRNGSAAIEHGRYYLFNHGPVHPISRSTSLALREDDKRLFSSGAAVLLIAAAGLLRMERLGRKNMATLPMLVNDV